LKLKLKKSKEEPEKENFQDSIKKNKKENNVVRSLDKNINKAKGVNLIEQ